MNTRKDNKGKALKAWIKTPVGHIAKPLRHIISRDSSRGLKGEIILGAKARMSIAAASIGNGLFVQTMARSLA